MEDNDEVLEFFQESLSMQEEHYPGQENFQTC